MRKIKSACVCSLCKSDVAFRHSENDLHIYVGMHKSNNKCDLNIFESDIDYKAVTHWDVGFADEARYYIYFNDDGNAIAWYDSINEIGYKNSNTLVV